MELLTSVMLCVFVMLVLWWKKMTKDENKELPPGSLGLPFIGESLQFLLEKDFPGSRHKKHGYVFKTHLFGKPFVIVAGTTHAEKVLMGENVTVQSYYPQSLREIFGLETVPILNGTAHSLRKKWLLSMFTRRAVDSYLPKVESIIKKCITEWKSRTGPVMMTDSARDLAMRAASDVLAGVTDSQKSTEMVELMTVMTENLLSLPVNLPGFGYRKALAARAKIKQIISTSLMSPDSIKQGTILDTIMKSLNKAGLSAENDKGLISEEVISLFLASNANLVSSMTLCVMNLDKYPDMKQKIREESDMLPSADISVDSLRRKAPYTNAFIAEVLRHYPTIGGPFRKLLQPYKIENYTIPAGWHIIVSFRETHMMAQNVPKVTEFYPSRWLADDALDKVKFEYIPFGKGKRACVGREYAEMFLCMFTMRFSELDFTSISDKELKQIPVPMPIDKLPIILQK